MGTVAGKIQLRESQRSLRVPAARVSCRKWQKPKVSLLLPMMASTSTSCRGSQHLSASYRRETTVVLVTPTTCLTQESAFRLVRDYVRAATGGSRPQFGIKLARKSGHLPTAVQEAPLLLHSLRAPCCSESLFKQANGETSTKHWINSDFSSATYSFGV